MCCRYHVLAESVVDVGKGLISCILLTGIVGHVHLQLCNMCAL
jgi:hypothetical protein